MKKLLALLTLLLPLTAAQAPVYSVVGGRLLCGMYLRAAGQVQTWCWAGLDPQTSPLIHNAVTTLPAEGGAAMVTAVYRQDSIVWHLTFKAPGQVLYEFVSDGKTIRSGTL